MTEDDAPGRKARSFFDGLWAQGDPWRLESSAFERERYEMLLSMLAGRRYPRVLEIGCGAGAFTGLLAPLADRLLALDIAPAAIARARERHGGREGVEFRVANVVEYEPGAEGPWDLVVMAETVYYLGWLYSFFAVAWLAAELYRATRPGGRLLLANTEGEIEDFLVRPWLIRAYRDLFRNVGYEIETERRWRGTKDGADLAVLASLLRKP
jgi:SAM-dependent methyltransferase